MTHAEARRIIEAAWTQVHGRPPSASEALYAQAIAYLETGYGRADQFQKYAESGQYNWGNIERRRNAEDDCPDGWVPGVDQGPVCFRAFSSDVEAAAYFIRVLTKGHWPVVQAMRGSPLDVASAMRASPAYYTGPEGSEGDKRAYYAKAITNAIHAIGEDAPTGAKVGFGALGLLVVLAGGWTAYRWYEGKPLLPSLSSLPRLRWPF